MNFIDLDIGGKPDAKPEPKIKTKETGYIFSPTIRENQNFNNDKKASAHQQSE
jgi:hypothetical protein